MRKHIAVGTLWVLEVFMIPIFPHALLGFLAGASVMLTVFLYWSEIMYFLHRLSNGRFGKAMPARSSGRMGAEVPDEFIDVETHNEALKRMFSDVPLAGMKRPKRMARYRKPSGEVYEKLFRECDD